MDSERYKDVRSSIDNSEYKFISEGKDGLIEKVVQYKIFDEALPDLYNLGFGHLHENGKSIDDTVRADNGDMMKILSTVAFTVNDFVKHYPKKRIYIRGSDPVRTRVYQMAISKYYGEISKEYKIYGHLLEHMAEGSEGKYHLEPFQKNKNYFGFLVVRK